MAKGMSKGGKGMKSPQPGQMEKPVSKPHNRRIPNPDAKQRDELSQKEIIRREPK